jgi:hypothetical protein
MPMIAMTLSIPPDKFADGERRWPRWRVLAGQSLQPPGAGKV